MIRHDGVDPARAAQFRRDGSWGDASLVDFWDLSVRACPDKLAVVDSRGTRWTYRQVDERARRLAGWLRAAGVRAGDVVSVQLPNWAQFLLVDVACLRLGAVVNPVLTQHRHAELSAALNLCRSRVLVVPARFRSMTYGPLAARLLDEVASLRTVLVVEHDGVSAGPHPSLDQAVLDGPALGPDEGTPGRGQDVAAVLFTSGSEATPKGVMLSHDNLIYVERVFAQELGIGVADRMFMPAPLAHATGFMHGLTMPFVVGATSVLLDVVTGDASLRTVLAEGCTCGMAAASVVRCFLDACDREGATTPTLRLLGCGGAPVPRVLLERAKARGIALRSIYGSTESAPHTLTTAADDDERVLGTDGRPVTGTQVKIVDPVTRTRLPAGVEGEEASRGPGVFLGYLGAPELTASVLDADGWYYSGDLAVMDEAGYVRITGRRKDTIIRGGENISAVEVENLVREMPGVQDVAVVAFPDERLGERACAYVVPQPGLPGPDLAAMRAFFDARGVAKYKTPEWVEVVDALPMTPSGKVRKVELRARIAAQAALARAGTV